MKLLIGLVAMGLSFACSDNPYSREEEIVAVEAPKKQTLPVKAIAYSHVEGVAELGTPLFDAKINAFTFKDRKKGEHLGQCQTNKDGSFSLRINSDYEGPVLLESDGGTYLDLATNQSVPVKPGQGLRSVLAHSKMLQNINLNAFTTMATARVEAEKGFIDNKVGRLSDVDRINTDFSHMSYFLSVHNLKPLDITRQKLVHTKKSISISEPDARLFLYHGGLSELAFEFSKKWAGNGSVVSVLDLVLALSEDLSDRFFDGKNAQEKEVFLVDNKDEQLNSYTVRKAWAEAIFSFAKKLKTDLKISSHDLTELKSPRGLLNSLAQNNSPDLFPKTEQPIPIVITSPKIKVGFGGLHVNEQQFSVLDGNVYFQVSPQEKGTVKSIKLIAPQIGPSGKEGIFGPITINDLQNSAQIAINCNKREEFELAIKTTGYSEDDVYCACFEAEDNLGQKEKEIGCFIRKNILVSINEPANEAVLLPNTLTRNGIVLKASVSGGLALSACVWKIMDSENGREVRRGRGVISGSNCRVDGALHGSMLETGKYMFSVIARDILDRGLPREIFTRFSVRHNVYSFPNNIIRQ